MDFYTELYFTVDELTPEEIEWMKTTLSIVDATEIQRLLHESNISAPDAGIDEVDSWAFGFEFKDNSLAIECGLSGVNIDAVAGFLNMFLKKFRPTDEIQFEWANTASRPAADAYGGGACLVTIEGYDYCYTGELFDMIRERIKKNAKN